MGKKLDTAKKLYAAKNYEAALKLLMEIDEDPSDNIELAYYIGLSYAKLEKYEEALLYLEQVVTSDRNAVHVYQARMVLAWIYIITRRLRLAVFELDKLIEAGFESPQVYASKAYVEYRQNRIEESVENYRKALSCDSENPTALNSLGYILADKNINLEEALKLCKKAVSLKPDNPAYLDSLGWVFYRMGKKHDAKIYLRRALDLSSGNKEIAAHLKDVMAMGEAS